MPEQSRSKDQEERLSPLNIEGGGLSKKDTSSPPNSPTSAAINRSSEHLIMANTIPPDHEANLASPTHQDVNVVTEPLAEQNYIHHSNSDNLSSSGSSYSSDNSIAAVQVVHELPNTSRPPVPPRSHIVQENRRSVPTPEPHLPTSALQRQVPVLPQAPARMQRRRNVASNGTLGSANNYEEVVPLVEPRVFRNAAYNAVQTTNADEDTYTIPNVQRANQHRSQQRRNHRPNQQGQGANAQQNNAVQYYMPIIDSRQNNRFTLNMKRYIFTSLGVPGIPGMPPTPQKICSKFSFCLLFFHGCDPHKCPKSRKLYPK